jgi:hypothetical protein
MTELGFLLQWPPLAALLMFPVLAWSYARLARKEERRMEEEFGCCWQAYDHARPAFVPRLSRVAAVLGGFLVRGRWPWAGTDAGPAATTTHGRTRS